VDLSAVNLVIFASAGISLSGYVAFILIPAVNSYGRPWERVAAGFLSLFILASLLLVGLAAGLTIVYVYDQYLA
jgi:hypothetical protein